MISEHFDDYWTVGAAYKYVFKVAWYSDGTMYFSYLNVLPSVASKQVHVRKKLACVAGAKRGGRGGREKGKREGSACSKSLCFCITPTNFLVIRLRLLSIKCRYTRHCRKTLHSWTKEIRLVIQIQKAL